MASDIQVTVHYDPFIKRMAHHSVAMPEFRKEFARLMKENKAFEYTMLGKTGVTVHPSEELQNAFYSAMGLK